MTSRIEVFFSSGNWVFGSGHSLGAALVGAPEGSHTGPPGPTPKCGTNDRVLDYRWGPGTRDRPTDKPRA